MKKQKVYATHVTLDDGSRIYVRANSAEERAAKVNEVKARQGLGMANGTTTTFGEYAALWLDTYRPESAYRPTSYAAILNTFNNHVVPFFADMPLAAIRNIHIHKYLKHISTTSKSQQAKSWQMLKAIFSTAVDNHLIAESPIKSDDKLSRGESKEDEEPLTDEQVKRLLLATENAPIGKFVRLALGTGMRKGEILGLMWEDVDLSSGVVEVRHNKAIPANKNDAPVSAFPKTDAGRRRIPLPTKLVEMLKYDYANHNSDFVFAMTNGQSYTRSAFRSAWQFIDRRTAGKRADGKGLGETYGDVAVELDFTTHPHQLRHTYITKLFEQGLDLKQVQYLAGHASPEMTMRVYTHYRQKQRDADTAEQVRAGVDYL